MFSRIHCDWALSDGILPPVRLETPETVAPALRHAGLLKTRAAIMDELAEEWIYRRQWCYSAVFSAEESSSRRLLSVTDLHGDWTLCLNGNVLSSGNALRAEVRIDPSLIKKENRIEIRFQAPDASAIAPELGFCGAISLREIGPVAILTLRAQDSPSEGDCLLAEVDADDERPCQLTFSMRSKIAEYENTLSVNLTRGVQVLSLSPFAAGNWPRGERVIVTLTVFVDGLASDKSAFGVYMPAQAMIPRGFEARNEFAAAACAQAGGNVLCGPADAAVLACDHRLALAAPDDRAVLALSALAREALLLRLTDDNLEALEDKALWMLTGSDRSALLATLRPFSLSDIQWPDASRLSRYFQATNLRCRAENARLDEEAFIVKNACDTTPRCASQALFDADSRPRPAYGALADAWKKDHAFARPPKAFPEDGIINLPIYYVSDESSAGVTINAIALRQDGQELVSATFPALGRANGLVGRLCTEVPEDGLLILRVRVLRNGECVSVSDDVISRRPEDLANLKQTQLIWDGNTLRNAGKSAAVGVSVPGARFFGALLPGETVTASGAPDAEALNTFE